nr:hypothetical protein [uncultured archaeon]
MGKRSRLLKGKLTDLTKPEKPKLRAVLVVLLVATIISTSALVLSYSNFTPKFLPQSYLFALDSLIAKLPLLPKTPRQVLAAAILKNRTLTSYTFSANLLVKLPNGNSLANITMSGEFSDLVDSKSQAQATLMGKISEFFVGEINLRTIELSDDFYFLVEKAPPFPGYNLNRLVGDWQKVNLPKFQNNLGTSSKTDAQIVKDVRVQMESFYTGLIGEALSQTEDFRQIEEKGSQYYRITLTPPVQNLGEVLNFGEALETREVQIKIFINKGNFNLTKISVEAKLLPKEAGLDEQLVEVAFDYQIAPVSEAKILTPPPEFSEISGPLDLTIRLLPEADQVTPDNLRIGETGENFLTLERLLKVLLLLPKSL